MGKRRNGLLPRAAWTAKRYGHGRCALIPKWRNTRAAGVSTRRRTSSAKRLLCLLLLLLADAHLEVQLFGFLERFVIVPRHGVGQILVDTGVFRQNRHYG